MQARRAKWFQLRNGGLSIRRRTPVVAVALVAAVAVGVSGAVAATLGSASSAAAAKKTPFQLRVGDVMSFTGDLSGFGPSLDQGARLGADTINKAAKKVGAGKFSIKIVDSQDDQTQIPPAVEAATKLVDQDKVNVILGTISSGSTIAVAQSVSIPRHVFQITPTSSNPAIGTLKAGNPRTVWQILPSDTFQARELVDALRTSVGAKAKLNVGWRNDAWGNGVSTLFVSAWKKGGGSIGTTDSWDPNSPNLDADAGRLVSGSPTAWVIFDFPPDFAKLGPALVRTGKWTPTKTFVTAEMRDATAISNLGSQATEGLRGVSSSNGTTPLQSRFAAYFKAHANGKPFTGYEGSAFDAVVVTYLAALKADSTNASKIGKYMRWVTNSPGKHYTYLNLGAAIKAVLAGKKIKYDGITGQLALGSDGFPTAGRYDIWTVRSGQPVTLSTHSITG